MIGILPAAGKAERFMRLPKYLFPVGNSYLLARHIDMMSEAGIEHILIPCHSRDSSILYELADCYNPQVISFSIQYNQTMSASVLSVRKHELYDGDDVLFGMPDTYLDHSDLSDNPYRSMAKQLELGADLVIGIFNPKPDQISHVGMLHVVGDGKVIAVLDKPDQSNWIWAWGTLAWKPVFWDYIRPEDPHIGYAIPRAITAGLDIRTAVIETYFDCGTPERYYQLIMWILNHYHWNIK